MEKKIDMKVKDLVKVLDECGLCVKGTGNGEIRLNEYLKVKKWGEEFNKKQREKKIAHARQLIEDIAKSRER